MTKTRYSRQIGSAIVIAHFLLILIVVFSPAFAGILVADALSLLTVIVPLFAAFTTVVLRNAIKNAEAVEDNSPQVTGYFRFMGYFVVSVFCITIWGLSLGYVFDWIPMSLENVKIGLALVESAIGVFVGFFVDALFRSEPTEEGG